MIDEDQDCFDFEYKTSTGRVVRGYQVGRFCVRYAALGGRLLDRAGNQRPLKPWLVDHWPSGFGIRDAETFADAVVIADCVSAFSEKDPVSTGRDDFIRQMGPLMPMWIQWMEENDGRVVDFREWAKAYEIAGKRSDQDYDVP